MFHSKDKLITDCHYTLTRKGISVDKFSKILKLFVMNLRAAICLIVILTGGTFRS